MSALTTIETNAVSAQRANQPFDLSPRTFDQALTFSQYLADSELVPKDFRGKPANCLIAVQWGAEIGLKPLQAIQNIAVINGRPAIWGDAVIAVVRSSPVCEYVIESQTATEATCRVKRRGEPEQIRTFSTDDAKRAGLLGKQGPWTQYPKRMMQMRARAFALRDVFPDVLRGLPVAEEVMDIPAEPVHMGAAQPAQHVHSAQPAGSTKNALDDAEAAAAHGMAAYADFWKSASPDVRKALKNDHARLKEIAAAADEDRTVINERKQPVATFDDVMLAMIAAQDIDALNAAYGRITGAISPEESQVLDGKYNELKDQLQ